MRKKKIMDTIVNFHNSSIEKYVIENRILKNFIIENYEKDIIKVFKEKHGIELEEIVVG